MTLADVTTPALIVDVPTMQRNISRMAAFFADGPCQLRPHFKAHKTPEIARRQLAAGSAVGLTCATVFEAEIAGAWCADLLIANEIVAAHTCDRVAALASGGRKVTVAVDSIVGLEAIATAARRASVVVHVLIDVNVGQNRCGVAPGPDALALATRAHATAGVSLAGVMGYEGHVQALVGRDTREAAAKSAMASLVNTAQLIRANRLPCETVSAGGTGTYDISGRMEGVTEIQAGSYALMDSDYGRLDLPFEQALFLLTTAVSRPTRDRLILDCGHKACAKDHGVPLVLGISGAAVVGLNDEHATVSVPSDALVSVGDRIRLCPSHIDPTMNLHDVVYAVDGDVLLDTWRITARGYGAVSNQVG